MLSDKEICKMVGCKKSEWCFGEVDECADAGFMKVAAKAQEAATQVEERKKLGKWARGLYHLAENGDYSNGNEAFGVDEGNALAGGMLSKYDSEIEALLRGEELEVKDAED